MQVYSYWSGLSALSVLVPLLINSDTGLNEVRPVSYSIVNSFELVSMHQKKAMHYLTDT